MIRRTDPMIYRYFKIEPEIEYEGCVVDQTEWKLSKTASWDNYVKIKIDDSNASFWIRAKRGSAYGVLL